MMGFHWRWSTRLVLLYYHTSCIFIWRRDPAFRVHYPHWRLSLPWGMTLERWSRRDEKTVASCNK